MNVEISTGEPLTPPPMLKTQEKKDQAGAEALLAQQNVEASTVVPATQASEESNTRPRPPEMLMSKNRGADTTHRPDPLDVSDHSNTSPAQQREWTPPTPVQQPTQESNEESTKLATLNLSDDCRRLLENDDASDLKNAFLAAADYNSRRGTGLFSWFRHGATGRAQTAEFINELKNIADTASKNSSATSHEQKEDSTNTIGVQVLAATYNWLKGTNSRRGTGGGDSSRLRYAADNGLLGCEKSYTSMSNREKTDLRNFVMNPPGFTKPANQPQRSN